MAVPSPSRRTFLQLSGGLGLSAVLAGCANPGTVTGGGNAKQLTGTLGTVTGTIDFAHWRGQDKAVFDQLITAFKAVHPKAGVKQDISTSDSYQSRALTQLRDGRAGDAFTAFRGAQFLQMSKAGLFSDLSGLDILARYQPKFITGGANDGKQLGLPYQLVFNMPMVNTDLLGEHGYSQLPTDWDGFLGMCDKLKTAGITPLAWPAGDAGNVGQFMNCMVMNNGPTDDMFAQIQSGKYKCTDDWFVKTLTQYQQLKPYFQADASGSKSEPLQLQFAQGKAAMLATGSFHASAVRKLGAQFAIGLYAPITTTAAQARHEGIYNATFILGVNSKSTKPGAALAWLEFLSDPVNAAVYANGTAQHVTVANVAYTDRDLKAFQPWLSKKTLLAPRFQLTNLDLQNAIDNAPVKVINGTDPAEVARQTQKIVDQKR